MSVNPDVVFVSGPTYQTAPGQNHLLPFTYSNGKLDLPSSGPYASGTDAIPVGNAGASVRVLGGTNIVLTIGTNLQNFLRSKVWDTYTLNPSAPITVVSNGYVTRVQQLSSNFLAPTWDKASYKVTLARWDNSNFVGDNAVYVFLKPLVLQVTNTAGQTMCITLQTSWDN
jgi:hypothetical protein